MRDGLRGHVVGCWGPSRAQGALGPECGVLGAVLRRLVGASPAPNDFHDVLVGAGARGDFQLAGLKLVHSLNASAVELLRLEALRPAPSGARHGSSGTVHVAPLPKEGCPVAVIALCRIDAARTLREVVSKPAASKDAPKSLLVRQRARRRCMGPLLFVAREL